MIVDSLYAEGLRGRQQGGTGTGFRGRNLALRAGTKAERTDRRWAGLVPVGQAVSNCKAKGIGKAVGEGVRVAANFQTPDQKRHSVNLANGNLNSMAEQGLHALIARGAGVDAIDAQSF